MTSIGPSAFQFRVQPEDLIPQSLGGLDENDAFDIMAKFLQDIQDFYALLQDPGVGGGVDTGGGGGGGAPTGPAGGSLDGTYPNPGIAGSVAGGGLVESGNVLGVNVDNTTVEIVGDVVGVKGSGIGPTQLASTAVAAGTYGNATNVGQFTVDSDGRITFAANVAVSAGGGGAPTGAAGGALDGTYPNPGLNASVAGAGLTETADVLAVNVDNATLEVNADVVRVKAAGIGANELASTAVAPGTYGNGTNVAQVTVDADGRLTFAGNVAITGGGGAPSGPAGGVLDGTYPNPGLVNTAVTPGSYGGLSTNVVLTVDADGRLTAASTLSDSYTVYARFDAVTNTGAAETDLYTPTLAANVLKSDGDSLDVLIAGAYAAHASNTRLIKMYFGATAFFLPTAVTSVNAGNWIGRFTITRQSNTTILYACRLDQPTAPSPWSQQTVGSVGSLNLAATAYSMKVTGTATSTAQITLNQMRVIYYPYA